MKDQSIMLVNFAGALFGLYFVTMLAFGEDMPQGACRLWAFLQVYFFNAALCWGLSEALFLFLNQMLSSFGEGFFTKYYVWIAMIFSWSKSRKISIQINFVFICMYVYVHSLSFITCTGVSGRTGLLWRKATVSMA